MQYPREYLSGRKFQVEIETFYEQYRGEWLENYSGVLQGSVIGPWLFIMWLDSLLCEVGEILPASSYVAFADDLALTLVAETDAELEQTANKVCEQIWNWTVKHRQPLHPQKTSLVLVHSVAKGFAPCVLMGQGPVRIVEEKRPSTMRLGIAATPGSDMRRYNRPQAYEPAVCFWSADGVPPTNRDFAVWPRYPNYHTYRIPDTSEHIDPLAYPLLFPEGDGTPTCSTRRLREPRKTPGLHPCSSTRTA